MLTDGLLLLGAALLGYLARTGGIISTDVPLAQFVPSSVIGALIGLVLLVAGGYYRLSHQSRLSRILTLFISSVASAGGTALAYFFITQSVFSRGLVVIAAVVAFGLLWVSDGAFLAVLRRWKTHRKYVTPALVVGANRISQQLVRALADDPYSAYAVVGCVDPYGVTQQLSGLPVLGKLNKIESLCQEHNVGAVFQTDGYEHAASVHGVAQQQGAEYWYVPALRGIIERPQLRPITEHLGVLPIGAPQARGQRFVQRQVFGTLW